VIAWIATKTGLSLLMVKIILCAVSIGAILYGLRLWGNSQWYKGETQGRITATQSIEKAKRDEWKAKEAAIAAGTATLDTEKRAVMAATDQLAADRATIGRNLKDGLAQIQRERNRQYESTAAVPDTLLWDAIRTVSAELAAAK
jgi:hypothetical protein